MTVIKTTVKNGKIELQVPSDWPDGVEVRIEPISRAELIGMREENWPTTPEQMARHLDLMDRIEPMDITAEEEAGWQAARVARKNFEKSGFEAHAEALGKGWE